MTERRPRRASRSPERAAPPWDTAAIAAALRATPEPRLDELRGPGVRLRLGTPPATDLDLFPARLELRLASADLSINLSPQRAPVLAHEAVVFESPTSVLSVNRSGALTLVFTPALDTTELDATVAPLVPPTTTEGPDVPPDPRTGVAVDLVTPPEVLPTLPPTTDDVRPNDGAPEKEPRVRLTGRLGTDVRYRETRNGKLVGSFPVAVTQDDASVRWHSVKVFGDRAAKLRDSGLTRGQLADVVGYLHRREVEGKDGVRVEEEVYAVVVKPR